MAFRFLEKLLFILLHTTYSTRTRPTVSINSSKHIQDDTYISAYLVFLATAWISSIKNNTGISSCSTGVCCLKRIPMAVLSVLHHDRNPTHRTGGPSNRYAPRSTVSFTRRQQAFLPTTYLPVSVRTCLIHKLP